MHHHYVSQFGFRRLPAPGVLTHPRASLRVICPAQHTIRVIQVLLSNILRDGRTHALGIASMQGKVTFGLAVFLVAILLNPASAAVAIVPAHPWCPPWKAPLQAPCCRLSTPPIPVAQLPSEEMPIAVLAVHVQSALAPPPA